MSATLAHAVRIITQLISKPSLARYCRRWCFTDSCAKEVGPDLFILRFNERGPVICVRPYCHTDHYWQVYADTNAIIRDVLGDSAFSVPAQTVRIVQA